MAQEQKKTLGVAITSLVFGILGLIIAWIPLIGLLLCLVALILGIVALVQISKNKETAGGNGLAIAGIILGSIGLIIAFFVMLLAAVAIPRFVQLTEEAKGASEEGMVGSVRSGIYTYYAVNRSFPSTLDNASAGYCASDNPCFGNVLEYEVTRDWKKISDNLYKGPAGNLYNYDSYNGSFEP